MALTLLHSYNLTDLKHKALRNTDAHAVTGGWTLTVLQRHTDAHAYPGGGGDSYALTILTILLTLFTRLYDIQSPPMRK